MIDLPLRFEDEDGEISTVVVKVHVIQAEIPLLLGRKFLRLYNVSVSHEMGTALMDLDITRKFRMIDGDKGHWLLLRQHM